MNITYKKAEAKEENADPKAVLIEQHGYVPTFTLADIESNILANEKSIKELTAKKQYENARKENVEHYNPFILKDLTEEQRYAVHMHTEAAAMIKACDAKLLELEASLKADKEEMESIKEQIPELFAVESPYVAPAAEAEPVSEEKPSETDEGAES